MRKPALAALALFSLALPASGAQPPKERAAGPNGRTVTLISEAQVRAKPEIGLVTVYFTGYGWTVDKARAKADQLVQKFLDRLAKDKITPSQTQVGAARLKPSYQFNRDLKASVPSDFLITRPVVLQFDDPAQIAKIMDASIAEGSFYVDQARLSVKDKEDLGRQAFQRALEKGKKKAFDIAQSLGAEVGGVIGVEELASSVQDLNLIEDTNLAGLAAGRAKPAPEDASGNVQLPSENAAPDLFPPTDGVEARCQLRITYSLK